MTGHRQTIEEMREAMRRPPYHIREARKAHRRAIRRRKVMTAVMCALGGVWLVAMYVIATYMIEAYCRFGC